jgi:NAD(P)-dependent dehydrogenase (short-subunit alcohol dehydrogenase family)
MAVQRALVVGASGGIGAAMASALEAAGAEVTRLSRREDGFDIASQESIARHLSVLDPPYYLIFVATGVLTAQADGPEKTLAALDPEEFMAQMRINALGPALVLSHARRLMPRDRRAVFAALSARVGSIGDNGLGGWYSYRASKAALNQLLRTGAIELARSHPQALCLLLHPGTVETSFTSGYKAQKLTPDRAAGHLLDVIATLGPADSGGFYDWRGQPVPW